MIQQGQEAMRLICFSDECSVQAIQKGRQVRQWIKHGREGLNLPTNVQVQAGGFSVMFWGCVSIYGPGPIIPIDGTMRKEQYLVLLEEVVIPCLKELEEVSGTQFTYMQDNAPCHKAMVVTTFLDEQGVQRLDWPAQSPDLNPIENMWAIAKAARVDKFGAPTSRQQLISQFEEVWRNISIETCQNLILSFENRCHEVIKSEGKAIDY
ncbi:hypothetical protein MIR68_000996 [Amoeboaphelidium protococcarum]|nr:hypothetical protein MIR68_000996 [Amoeboaphelidium protococcarum]